MTSLNGWHRGERAVRRKTGIDAIASTAYLWTNIAGEMPEQHSTFYTSRLPFVPVCVLDGAGRPWGSILAGRDGKEGFILHPRYNTLAIEAQLWTGDPFLHILRENEKEDEKEDRNGPEQIAGIGVEVSTRRRNKFAGDILKLSLKKDAALHLELIVSEALGNCPKYITLRELTPYPGASSVVVEVRFCLAAGERLSAEAVAFVLASDTVFFGTTYTAADAEAKEHPSHLGMNHRGGRPGFIRVKPSDGRTIVMPDFSGNRFLTSLGNVEATPLASLTFIDFETGDILYLTGDARNLYGADARSVMPLQDTLTEVYVTGYTFVRNALPARLQSGYQIHGSPYSPPIKLLTEEAPEAHLFALDRQPTALLTRITMHSPTIATFAWEASVPVRAEAGQAIIMDFRPLLGSRRYQHMSPGKPSLVNDDFIRTWTISSAAPQDAGARTFALTVREQPGGTVTGAMFSLARKLKQVKPAALDDARDLEFKVNIVGVSGEFVLPRLLDDVDSLSVVRPPSSRRLIWIAGGIGVTPFLSMLAAISSRKEAPPWQITLVVSTREADVILSLISSALGHGTATPSYLSIHIFTHAPPLSDEDKSGVVFTQHTGRIRPLVFCDKGDFSEDNYTEFYLCGSQPFECAVLSSLAELRVDPARIHKENFAY